MAMHHLTHFRYEDTSFEGWRVDVQRSGVLFRRYFSTLEYGGEDAARREAIRIRDAIMQALERTPDKPQEVFRLFAKKDPARFFPAGLYPPRPRKNFSAPGKTHRRIITVKCQAGLNARVSQLVAHLRLDHSSVMRLALYALYTLVYQEENREKNLRQLVAFLEQMNINLTLSDFINHPPAPPETRKDA